MGPSASQHPGDDGSKIAELVKALSFLQVAIKEPWAQKALNSDLSGLLGVPHCEMKDAKDGKPAGSAPKPATPPVDTRVTDPVKDLEQPPKNELVNPDPNDVAPIPKALPTVPSPDPIIPTASTTPTPSSETPAPGSADGALRPPVINSSTHRAAHARLQRKMGSLTEAEAPNMHRLFNGSRKDCSLASKCEKHTLLNWLRFRG